MATFLQATAAVLVASVLGLTLAKQNKEITMLLVIAVSSMVILMAISFLKPVMDLLKQLEFLGDLDGTMAQILLKVTGIGLVGEMAAMICTDSDNASLGKALHFLGNAVILWLSLPVFQSLLDLIQQILGDL